LIFNIISYLLSFNIISTTRYGSYSDNVLLSFFFIRSKSDVPTLQIAFQYSVVVPPQELSNSGAVSTSRYIHTLLYGCFLYHVW